MQSTKNDFLKMKLNSFYQCLIYQFFDEVKVYKLQQKLYRWCLTINTPFHKM